MDTIGNFILLRYAHTNEKQFHLVSYKVLMLVKIIINIHHNSIQTHRVSAGTALRASPGILFYLLTTYRVQSTVTFTIIYIYVLNTILDDRHSSLSRLTDSRSSKAFSSIAQYPPAFSLMHTLR